MNNIIDRKPLNNKTHNVRRNQVILQYGVGAMIDFPSQVLMTALPESWEHCETIHDERLEKLLEVDKFVTPSEKYGVSFVRFPRWYFCPKCRRFQPIENWQKEIARSRISGQTDDTYMVRKLKCAACNVELVPARIIVACKKGHIDDFPWVEWVHARNFGGAKDICAHPSLKIHTGGSASSGLEGIKIECTNCHAMATLSGAFDKNVFKELSDSADSRFNFECTGKHPWENEEESCDEYPRTFQRGASSVYFPRVVSSLVIPPYSNIVNTKIENSENYGKLLNVLEDNLADCEESEKKSVINDKIARFSEKIANEIFQKKETVTLILSRKLHKSKEDSIEDKEQKYKFEEYQALTGTISSASFNQDEFLREGIAGNLYSIPGVKSVALVHKVKEVTALIGYSRILPTNGMDTTTENFVCIKKNETKFYPACSSKGEGIFLEFDMTDINQWLSSDYFQERAEKLNAKYKSSYFGANRNITVDSKLLFIHTIAHILIKELSFNSGYPISSLRERLYFGNVGEQSMNGLLIYTTGGDTEGTLGGLVRQGQTDCLPGIFKKALSAAQFCANDPVCSLSDGQGLDALNLAACHACTLLPETCCEFGNVLLDRVELIGTIEHPELGYYNNWLKK